MYRKLVIHIGMPKTGSSSIQDTFFKNFNGEDIRYAKLGMVNHGGIILSLFEDDPRRWHYHVQVAHTDDEIRSFNERHRAILQDQIEGNKSRILIISGEDIWHMSSDGLARFRDYVSPFFDAVEIYGYVRTPVSFMESAFQQLVKNHSLKEFDWSQIYPEYRSKFEKFDSVFGRDRVVLRKFESSSFPKGNVVLDFCKYLNVDFNENKILRSNDALSVECIALLYTYRKYGPLEKNGKMDFKSNRMLVEALSSIGGSKLRFSKELVSPVLTAYRDDIDWMEARLGNSLDELVENDVTLISSETQLVNIAIAQQTVLMEIVLKQLSSSETLTPEMNIAKIIDDFREALIGDTFLFNSSVQNYAVSFFNDQELARLRNISSEPADMLRDLALALERNGSLEAARNIIVQAIKLRPSGPGINKIYDRIVSGNVS